MDNNISFKQPSYNDTPWQNIPALSGRQWTGAITRSTLSVAVKGTDDRNRGAPPGYKKSYYRLTSSNGLITAVYDEQHSEIENLYPHIFSYYDSAVPVKPVAQKIKLNTPYESLAASYFQHTHIIKVAYQKFNIFFFTSFIKQDKILYAVAKGKEQDIKNLNFNLKNGAGTMTTSSIMKSRGNLAEKYFLFAFADTLHALPYIQSALKYIQHKDLLYQELQYMKNIFSQCRIPAAITSAERRVFLQSISILKMSQVSDKEIFPLSRGQVLASLRPGIWAISWVRDAAFAIEAMSKLGRYKEAKKALLFMLNAAPTNQYIAYKHTDGRDYGIGVPYIISVTRYFGNGREESDFNEQGPNIEIDDFGLFLIAFYHYIQQSGDKKFLIEYSTALDTIANAIIHNINENKIIRRDSGPWEHHLPGKEYMWTSGVCARGLELMAYLFQSSNLPFKKYKDAAKLLKEGIINHGVVDGKYIKGNATEMLTTDHHYFDAATFELFANGLIRDKKLFASHIKEYDKHNRAMNDPERGYIRFNSDDSYENQEWPFAGLRVAVAQNQFGSKIQAKWLINRVTKFANKNNNQIPEIFSNTDGEYQGAIPMVGYGAGAYILAVLHYYNNENN